MTQYNKNGFSPCGCHRLATEEQTEKFIKNLKDIEEHPENYKKTIRGDNTTHERKYNIIERYCKAYEYGGIEFILGSGDAIFDLKIFEIVSILFILSMVFMSLLAWLLIHYGG